MAILASSERCRTAEAAAAVSVGKSALEDPSYVNHLPTATRNQVDCVLSNWEFFSYFWNRFNGALLQNVILQGRIQEMARIRAAHKNHALHEAVKVNGERLGTATVPQ